MLRMAVRSMRAHRARLLMPALAVVLGVAFVVGALLYGSCVRAATTRAQQRAQPGLSVEVSSSWSGPGLHADLVTTLAGVAGVGAKNFGRFQWVAAIRRWNALASGAACVRRMS